MLHQTSNVLHIAIVALWLSLSTLASSSKVPVAPVTSTSSESVVSFPSSFSDFQIGQCDLVLARFSPKSVSYHERERNGHGYDDDDDDDDDDSDSDDDDNDVAFEIQVRTRIRPHDTQLTFVDAVAIKIGRRLGSRTYQDDKSDVLEVRSDGTYYINGLSMKIDDIDSFLEDGTITTLQDRYTVTWNVQEQEQPQQEGRNREFQQYRINIGMESAVDINVFESNDDNNSGSIEIQLHNLSSSLDVGVITEGLLGSFVHDDNDDEADPYPSTGRMVSGRKLLGRDHQTKFVETDILRWQNEWQVRDTMIEPSLFMQRQGPQYPTYCSMV